MSNFAFIQSLEAAKTVADVIPVDHNGPVLPLYPIEFRNLPVDQKIKDLMSTIMRSSGAYDMSERSTSIGDDTVGAMRQIHSNVPKYLPTASGGALSGRAKAYDAYAQAFKHHSADRGGGSATTGFVEYTAGDLAMYGWGGNRFRIVFNYRDSKLYFAPLHYASWTLTATTITTVDKPKGGSGHPNPFFWITNIK